MYLAKLKPIHPLLLRSAYPCDKTNHVRKYTVQACKSKEFHGINETQAEHVQGELIYKFSLHMFGLCFVNAMKLFRFTSLYCILANMVGFIAWISATQ